MTKRDWIIGIAIAIAVAGLLGPFAASAPDGLEWVAERLGFAARESAMPFLAGVLPGYAVPAIGDGPVSRALADIAGTMLVAGMLAGFGRFRRWRGENGVERG